MDNTIVKNITSQGIDKTAIKNFAVYARNKLIKDIKNKATMIGVTESDIQEPLSTSTGNIQLFDIGMQEPYRIEGKAIEQRNGLTRELKKRAEGSTYRTAYETLIEEVAYTWFNRIIAIRFMEVNNYMPDRMRILSSGVEGINEPEFITHVFETNFEFSKEEKERIIELKTDGSNLAMDELFQYLFIKQCNALNVNLPELFEKTNDYTELLLRVSYNDIEGVIYKLIHEVPEANFDVNSENGNGQVEIIGWFYQFYNTEPKATVFGRPKSKKIEKQDIPAATQLFTPEWIVKYMVENSLGRLWIEKLLTNGDSRTEKQIAGDFEWKYYLPEAEQDDSVQKQLENLRSERKKMSVEEITFLDPAMGSFHIGIYAFDIFMQLYESEGYTTREAAKLIIEKNLHGLDIDKRAAQLSYFASMMQARKYNRRILESNLQPTVYEIPESNYINREHLNYLGNDIEDKEEWNKLKLKLISLLNNFIDAKEYGSLMNISDNYDFSQLRKFVMSHSVDSQISLLETLGLEETQKELIDIINTAEVISKKYNIVITNPPYMSSSGMDKKLSEFAKKYYVDSKSDMFAMFIEKCKNYTTENGYFSMITQHAWMFLSSYEKLRDSLLMNTLVNMTHLGTRAFDEIGGEVVQTTSFVYLNQSVSNYSGNYVKLTDFDNQSKKEEAYLNLFNGYKKTYLYRTSQEKFEKIPGNPIAYWIPLNRIVGIYQKGTVLGDIVDIRKGLATGNVPLFIKYWHEISSSNFSVISNEAKWFPCHKGGEFNKWYGNFEKVINWEKDGFEIKNYRDRNGKLLSRPQNLSYMQKKGIVFSKITSGGASCRVMTGEELFDDAVQGIFVENPKLYNTIFGLLNSKISGFFLNFLNPTLNKQIYDLNRISVIKPSDDSEIDDVISDLIYQSKQDWDSFESSWDFESHPLITYQYGSEKLSQSFENWTQVAEERFNQLKEDEEELNRIFIDNYGLQEELTHEVEDKDVTVHRADLQRDVKSFLSYLVGIVFGRYSLDEKGLAFAGGEFNSSKYKIYQPVTNNLILLTQENYFNEDIVTKIEELVAIIYGETYIEENMQFLASAIGMKRNTTSRDTIRNYFVNNFYKDHTQTYKKRPIYWLYDSGKQNGFKALVYMHRYDEDTTGKVRVDYLHQIQRAYERTIANLQEDIVNSKDAKETSQLQKRLEKLTKQLKECRDYDERLGHMALERVLIDLDDGVKVNYEKVQTDSKGEFHQILAKIK